MSKKQGWVIYGLGFVLLTALDYFLFAYLFPQFMFAMAGVLEMLWFIGWLFYMSYRFDF